MDPGPAHTGECWLRVSPGRGSLLASRVELADRYHRVASLYFLIGNKIFTGDQSGIHSHESAHSWLTTSYEGQVFSAIDDGPGSFQSAAPIRLL
ncbi:hypothetical protein RSOLAG1IB_05572 [Rhizoctonia solani AG-1 IB]|uniref:Uncharacterized protein n=1 Tax=Thanatephorus cucumeris (strain AG1-IB / isolate 7/3/14) TaxID=1108050 RepID=A0A0B7G5N7_THACB|nr:hypothetical protein RSOLAG1IB_05572 [Rhizoctonia solani AG-1 IB]